RSQVPSIAMSRRNVTMGANPRPARAHLALTRAGALKHSLTTKSPAYNGPLAAERNSNGLPSRPKTHISGLREAESLWLLSGRGSLSSEPPNRWVHQRRRQPWPSRPFAAAQLAANPAPAKNSPQSHRAPHRQDPRS